MRGKHTRKAPKFRVFRAAAAFVLALVFSVFSFSTVMANTVSANVIDGDQSYTFSMDSADLDRILAQAERQGLKSLGPLDVAERVENTTTVNIRRGVPMTVLEDGESTHLVAYLGDTVSKTLADNNIVVKDGDELTPAGDTVVSAGLTVELRRLLRVKVTADGETRTLTLHGGVVADALKEAGVTLVGKDSANYDDGDALVDNMHIRVSRTVKITVVDGGTPAVYEVSAGSVRAALAKCGVALGEDDRLSVDAKAKPEDGMRIVITRVTAQEEEELEEIEFPVQVVTSDEMYEDQVEIRTPGQAGQRRKTYKLLYVDGELDGRELVAEEVIVEPVPQVVVQGTIPREEPAQEETPSQQEYHGGSVDVSGAPVDYVDVLVGSCTAYYPTYEGALTATGVKAGYGCVAVDPNQIPYGSLLYITSPDGSVVYGYGTAVDTGGFVGTGTLADLCYETEAECSIIGRRDMVIYVLRYGY